MKYDVCIVGSGAGAGPIAFELCKSGYKVLILEKGPWFKTAQFSKDEIKVIISTLNEIGAENALIEQAQTKIKLELDDIEMKHTKGYIN